jgi:hypothetical protein
VAVLLALIHRFIRILLQAEQQNMHPLFEALSGLGRAHHGSWPPTIDCSARWPVQGFKI